jgi:hypothetical protein
VGALSTLFGCALQSASARRSASWLSLAPPAAAARPTRDACVRGWGDSSTRFQCEDTHVVALLRLSVSVGVSVGVSMSCSPLRNSAALQQVEAEARWRRRLGAELDPGVVMVWRRLSYGADAADIAPGHLRGLDRSWSAAEEEEGEEGVPPTPTPQLPPAPSSMLDPRHPGPGPVCALSDDESLLADDEEAGVCHVKLGADVGPLGITFKPVSIERVEPEGLGQYRCAYTLRPGMALGAINGIPVQRLGFAAIRELTGAHGSSISGLTLTLHDMDGGHDGPDGGAEKEPLQAVPNSGDGSVPRPLGVDGGFSPGPVACGSSSDDDEAR